MRQPNNFPGLLTLIAGMLLIMPVQAHAYLDPGTGSFILQMVIAAIAGAAFTIKLYWQKLKLFFQNLTGKSAAEVDDGGVADKADDE